MFPDREHLVGSPSDPINELRSDVGDLENAEEILELRAKVAPQYIATICATTLALASGIVIGWTSPITIEIESGELNNIPVNEHQMGWIGAITVLGALMAGLVSGKICDAIGRKTTLLFLTLPLGVGWALILGATSLPMLYIGRFLTGIAVGGCSISAPMYINEICQKEIRGTLGSYFQIMITVGVLYSYLFGEILSIMYYTVACAVIPVVFLMVFIFQPETPVYYLKKHQYDNAATVMSKLRGIHYNPHAELQALEASIPNSTGTLHSYIFQLCRAKALFIALALMFFQQFCGINAIIFYTSDIFNAAHVNLNPKVSSIIIAVLQVFATFGSSLIVDRLGRRKLLIFSLSTMSLSCVLLGAFFTLKYRVGDENTIGALGFLPVFSLSCYIVAFSFGMGPIPWIIPSELFQPDIKGMATSIVGSFNWGLAFLITKFYLDIEIAVGQDVSFYFFAVMSFTGLLFVYFVLPETKGKSPDEIQRELET